MTAGCLAGNELLARDASRRIVTMGRMSACLEGKK